jgi:hypothetical protein
MPQLSLELHWHQICGYTQKRKLVALSNNMWMTSSLQQLTTKTFLNGQSSYFISYEKLNTKYPKEGSDLPRPSQVFRVSRLPTQWYLSAERKQAVCLSPTPTIRKQIHQSLVVAGFCQIWKPDFSLLAKPLYEANKWGKREPVIWESE